MTENPQQDIVVDPEQVSWWTAMESNNPGSVSPQGKEWRGWKTDQAISKTDQITHQYRLYQHKHPQRDISKQNPMPEWKIYNI